MRIHWIKLIVGALAAEIAAILILVCLVAIFGPKEASAAQAYAEKLGRWVGPLAGTLLAFAGAFWVARPLATGHVVHGALFGFFMALIDVALLIGMKAPFEWVFLASNTGRFIAAIAGGACAAKLGINRRTPRT
jgi:hypothetical protein